MSLDKKTCLRLGITVMLVYLGMHYWKFLSSLLLQGGRAAIPLFLGCVIAYIINIPMVFFEQGISNLEKIIKKEMPRKLKRPICIMLALISVLLILIVILYMIIPELAAGLRIIIEKTPQAFVKIERWIEHNIDIERIIKSGEEINSGWNSGINDEGEINWNTYVNRAVKYILSGIGTTINSIKDVLLSAFSIAVTALVSSVFSLYLLMGKEKLKKQVKLILYTYLGEKKEKRILYVLKTMDNAFHSFIVGQCIEAIILGLLCMLGMFILRLPYVSMIGSLVGFTALIPVAGAYIGMIVGALMIFTVSPIKALIFIIFLLILQQLENNLIYPRVVGSSIGLPGIWVLAAVTIGGGTFGIFGMLLGVPLAAGIYRLIKESVERRNQPSG